MGTISKHVIFTSSRSSSTVSFKFLYLFYLFDSLHSFISYILLYYFINRTKSTFIPLNKLMCSLSKTSPSQINNFLPIEQSISLVHSSPSSDHDYVAPSEFVKGLYYRNKYYCNILILMQQNIFR